MTRHLPVFCLITGLLAAEAAGVAGVSSSPPTANAAAANAVPPAPAQPAIRTGSRRQTSFWDDSLKAIKDGGSDAGGWVAYRRRLLVEATLTNQYFWFSITSFLGNAVLMYLFYASRVGEERKLWKATRAMTDLWNWALYSEWTARNTIDKFNAHVEKCNRTADGEIAQAAKTKGESDEFIRVQNERDALQQELAAARQELSQRDQVIAGLNTRVDELAKSICGGGDPQLTAQLMEKVNMLTTRNQHLEQQLQSAQTKLGKLAGERA
jgi:hypothetical protein